MEKKFIQTLSRFCTNPEESYLNVDFWTEMGFDLNMVTHHNKSTDGYTVINLGNIDNRWLIAIKYENFLKLLPTYPVIIASEALYEYKEHQK